MLPGANGAWELEITELCLLAKCISPFEKLFSSLANLCAYVCACAYTHMCSYTCGGDQRSTLSLLRSHPPCFLTQGLSLRPRALQLA